MINTIHRRWWENKHLFTYWNECGTLKRILTKSPLYDKNILFNEPAIILRIFMKEPGTGQSREAMAEHRLWAVGTPVFYIPSLKTSLECHKDQLGFCCKTSAISWILILSPNRNISFVFCFLPLLLPKGKKINTRNPSVKASFLSFM